MEQKYYFIIQDERITGLGQCPCSGEGIICVEVAEIMYNTALEKGTNYFIYDKETGAVEINPDYEKEEEEKKQEHIKSLTCTKRVFALMLQELGIDYLTQLKPLIESNAQAQLEWDLCVELSRSNPLLDTMASQLSITSEQLDKLFQYANGEITIEEFK